MLQERWNIKKKKKLERTVKCIGYTYMYQKCDINNLHDSIDI